MPTSFELALRWIWRAEGVDANNPHDKGGRTRYGISQAAHPAIDVSTLTAEHAAQIYRHEYWDARGCDLLPVRMGIALFDGAVNHGLGVADRMLQDVLGVAQDGIVGPKTAAAAKTADEQAVIERYLSSRGLFYHHIVQSDASQRVFLSGWLWRLFRLQRYLCCEVGNA